MNAQQTREVTLWLHDERLKYVAPKRITTSEFIEELRRSKEAIITELMASTSAFIITINGQQAAHADEYPTAIVTYETITRNTPPQKKATTIKLWRTSDHKLMRLAQFQAQKEATR